MRKAKIKNGFVGLRLIHLQSRKDLILAGMKDNAYFPATATLVAKIEAAGKEFDMLMIDIRQGNLTLIPRRDAIVETLTADLTTLGNMVMSIAKGDPVMLITTGFGLHKQPAVKGVATAPEGLTIKNNSISGFDVRIKKVKAAIAYYYEWISDEEKETAKWEKKQVSYVTYTIPKLVPGKRYWVRVAATDKMGNTVYCAPVSRIAQ